MRAGAKLFFMFLGKIRNREREMINPEIRISFFGPELPRRTKLYVLADRYSPFLKYMVFLGEAVSGSVRTFLALSKLQ